MIDDFTAAAASLFATCFQSLPRSFPAGLRFQAHGHATEEGTLTRCLRERPEVNQEIPDPHRASLHSLWTRGDTPRCREPSELSRTSLSRGQRTSIAGGSTSAPSIASAQMLPLREALPTPSDQRSRRSRRSLSRCTASCARRVLAAEFMSDLQPLSPVSFCVTELTCPHP